MDRSPGEPPHISAAPGPSTAARRAALKARAARVSVGASVLVVLAKGSAAAVSGSLALLVEAGHSLVDLAATLVTLAAVTASARPADEGHPYGHGKIEPLAALAEAGLLLVLAAGGAFEALRRMVQGVAEPVTPGAFVLGMLLFALLIDASRWRALSLAARETGSHALGADALHFASDFAGTLVVLVALGLASLGWHGADAPATLVVALVIARAAWVLARRTADVLIDAAPAGAAERVRDLALAVPGVIGVAGTRVRPLGDGVFAQVEAEVSRTLPAERLGEIKAEVADAIRAAFEGADVAVTTLPRAVDGETLLERVGVAAARQRVPVHNVFMAEVEGRLCVALDVEVDGAASLAEAHRLAHGLEADLRAELGPGAEVETHIEPLSVTPLGGSRAPEALVRAVAEAIAQAASATSAIREVHSVRVRETAAGLVAAYHCRADGRLDVAAVHAQVDAVERAVRAAVPSLRRIVGHAEPLREGGG